MYPKFSDSVTCANVFHLFFTRDIFFTRLLYTQLNVNRVIPTIVLHQDLSS